MLLQHLGHFDDWGKSAPACPAIPLLEELLCTRRILVAPEPTEVLLDRPCPGSLQFAFLEFLEFFTSLLAHIVFPESPQLFGSLQPLISFSLQCLVFPTTYLVDRLVEVLAHVKLVVDDLRLRRLLCCGIDVRCPHVHGHGFYLLALSRWERFPQLIGRFCGPVGSHFQHSGTVQIHQQRYVALATTKTFLAQPHMLDSPPPAPSQAANNPPCDDRGDGSPVQPEQVEHVGLDEKSFG